MKRIASVAGLASVTVTYNPDVSILARQLASLVDVPICVIVDNGSNESTQPMLEELASGFGNVRLLLLGENTGLAAGLNAGIRWVQRNCSPCSTIMLLDQDSEFDSSTPAALVSALSVLELQTGKACCVGPVVRDSTTGMPHGFHQVAGGWRWVRRYPPSDGPAEVVLNLNGSGTTFRLELIDRVGLLDESLFIDHVDTEWAFRLHAEGVVLFGIPWAEFTHRMGERSRRIWMAGWRVWPERSAIRHYYLFRNTRELLRRGYVPRVWKFWALVKVVFDLIVTMFIGPNRGDQVRMMWKGWRDCREKVVP